MSQVFSKHNELMLKLSERMKSFCLNCDPSNCAANSLIFVSVASVSRSSVSFFTVFVASLCPPPSEEGFLLSSNRTSLNLLPDLVLVKYMLCVIDDRCFCTSKSKLSSSMTKTDAGLWSALLTCVIVWACHLKFKITFFLVFFFKVHWKFIFCNQNFFPVSPAFCNEIDVSMDWN